MDKGPQRFFADAMLGKLARWMRTMGYDVEYEPHIDDGELLERAFAEGRVVLTRDTLLLKRRKARGRAFFIEGDGISGQLRQVAAAFPIDGGLFLTRCLRCNRPLERVAKPSVEGKVPPYVFRTQEEFSACPSCGRIYWGATHRERMEGELRRLLGG